MNGLLYMATLLMFTKSCKPVIRYYYYYYLDVRDPIVTFLVLTIPTTILA